ncbi:hypothetical protein FHT09_001219 [Xanthomonas arboricola]|uniref:hypothetical protein n=1 Tax=Xanthomonas TaxID=338 RepID=UPI0015E4351D|nr:MULTISPECIES: hypothetical protein [Xanthomonas]MBB5735520.1 hypothetical protein [Xanthomonas sp. CFBP 8152]
MRSSFISWSQCACAHALRLVAFDDSACGKQHGWQMNGHALALRPAAIPAGGHHAQNDGDTPEAMHRLQPCAMTVDQASSKPMHAAAQDTADGNTASAIAGRGRRG